MSRKNSTSDREMWVSILEAASTKLGDEINDEWRWLLTALGIPADCYFPLREAIVQGRWRAAKNPRAYIKTVARREALRDQIKAQKDDPLVLLRTTSDDDDPSPECSLDHISYVRETAESVRDADGIWRRGGGAERNYYDYYDEDEDGKPVSLRGRLLAKVPKCLTCVVEPPAEFVKAVDDLNATTDEWHIHVIPSVQVDIEKWGRLAGFDDGEMLVLQYRLQETSREVALSEQADEGSRKALQAAWRRYDRTGKERMKSWAEKNLNKNVPDDAVSYTS